MLFLDPSCTQHKGLATTNTSASSPQGGSSQISPPSYRPEHGNHGGLHLEPGAVGGVALQGLEPRCHHSGGFGEGHAAWDMSGFTPEQRTRQLEHVARLLRTLFAERLTLAPEATSSGGLFGFPRDLLLSILGNAEGREQLLRRFPALEGLLVERACLTNDLETEFSTIVRRCGYKAALAMVLGALHSVDTLFTVRRDPSLYLFPPAAAKATYNQQQQGAANATAWHDGSSARPSDTIWRRRADTATQQALRTVGAQATVRDYHRG